VIAVQTVDGLQQPSALENLRSLPPLPTYLRQVWDRRWFIVRVPTEELRAENSTTSLGSWWHLLNPLLFLGVYYVLFSVGLRADATIKHFTTYLSIGIFFFRYSEQAAQRGSRALTNNASLILSVRFPRLILPLTGVVTALIYLAIGMVALVIIAFADGALPRPSWLLVIPLIMLQTVFNTGLAALLARAVFQVHDVQNMIQHVFRVLFYASGVLFPVSAFFSDRWLIAFVVNPFFAFVSLYRWAILGDPAPSGTVLSALVWSAVIAVVGVWWFRRGELNYGRREF